MSALEDAARRYVAARERLYGADTAGLLQWVMAVDVAWHDLHQAAGLEVFDGCCDEQLALPLFADTETVEPRGEVL